MWLGKPSLMVLDCSSAGVLLPFFSGPVETPVVENPSAPPSSNTSAELQDEESASYSTRDTIVLGPCREGEWLPMHPDFPADIFTSCLTTPIPIALRWFVRQNRHSMAGLSLDSLKDGIPGMTNDRKTPLGELNWIFTSVTDSIAWNLLPKPLFRRLFRQDLMVARYVLYRQHR
jgi:regulatory associated protein of mTOR